MEPNELSTGVELITNTFCDLAKSLQTKSPDDFQYMADRLRAIDTPFAQKLSKLLDQFADDVELSHSNEIWRGALQLNAGTSRRKTFRESICDWLG